MIPDLPTITRRRHVATIIARSCIIVFAAWVMYGLVKTGGYAVSSVVMSGNPVANAIDMVFPDLLLLLFAACMFLVEARIVRWVVPLPPREAQCPSCGYSMKNLKSPICPECGTDLT